VNRQARRKAERRESSCLRRATPVADKKYSHSLSARLHCLIALFKVDPRAGTWQTHESVAPSSARTDAVRLRVARRRRSATSAQLALPWPSTWGGARKGAGRKPGPRPGTPHRARPVQRAAEPVHVTLRARLAPLRSQHVFPTVRLAFARAGRRDPDRFRVLHYSVQRDHVHLVVEARDKRALSSGVRSIAIRIARYVNDLLSRRGPFWATRWHGRALRTPREVRAALVYVLANFRKHAHRRLPAGIDGFSSGAQFDGWRGYAPHAGGAPPFACGPPLAGIDEPGIAVARTWLGRVGWRQHGLIGITEEPAAR
jgi:REP element-mobilizing transposase RayT